MDTAIDTKSDLASTVTDIRHVPLSSLPGTATESLRRIVPTVDSRSVPVAAFNASL